MNMCSVCLCVLVLGVLFECGHSRSPCPDIFNFYSDRENVFGQITVQPVETVFSLEIRINFTVRAALNNYVGRIVPPDDVLQKYNRGETVRYRVYFPVISPLPKVTEIAVNGDTICTGPGDKILPHEVVTYPSLKLTSSYEAPPPYKRFQHQPQMTPQLIPQMSLNHHDDTHIFPQHIKHNIANSPITVADYSPPVTQWPITARYTPTTNTTITTVYSEYVRKTTRLEQTFSNTTITMEECGVVANDSEISHQIHNGQSYKRGEIPWLVAIYLKLKKTLQFICGGTLVSDRHIVSAAHCMQGFKVRASEKTILVKLGVHDLNAWSDDIVVTAAVMAATIHESFNGSTLKNDIMVLTLNKHIEFNDFIRPACLWRGDTELSLIVGAIGVVAGWGDKESDEPQVQHVPIVSTEACRASNSDFEKLTSYNTLCAGARDGKGLCERSAGGGLYIKVGGKWRLRGVVSLSLQSGNRDLACNLDEYVVYTDTAQYLAWIRNVLSQQYFE